MNGQDSSTGTGYPADWDQRRRTVYERDDYQCQNCDKKGGPRSEVELHAHHIVPKGKGGTHQLSNLKTLCQECHYAIHGDSPAPTANTSAAEHQSAASTITNGDDGERVTHEYLIPFSPDVGAVYTALDQLFQAKQCVTEAADELHKAAATPRATGGRVEDSTDTIRTSANQTEVALKKFEIAIKDFYQADLSVLSTRDRPPLRRVQRLSTDLSQQLEQFVDAARAIATGTDSTDRPEYSEIVQNLEETTGEWADAATEASTTLYERMDEDADQVVDILSERSEDYWRPVGTVDDPTPFRCLACEEAQAVTPTKNRRILHCESCCTLYGRTHPIYFEVLRSDTGGEGAQIDKRHWIEAEFTDDDEIPSLEEWDTAATVHHHVELLSLVPVILIYFTSVSLFLANWQLIYVIPMLGLAAVLYIADSTLSKRIAPY